MIAVIGAIVLSPASSGVAAPGKDRRAPTTPSGLTLTGSTSTTLSLAWQPSSDNRRVAGYDLYRDGLAIGRTTATSALYDGLSCGTSYVLGVDAFDAVGNRSQLATVTASTSACSVSTTPTASDSPPSSPTGLTVTGTTETSASLAWQPSVDDIGVARYDISRDGARVASTSATSYTVADLACGTAYTLAVTAYDSAGNQSSPASVTASTTGCSTSTAPTSAGGPVPIPTSGAYFGAWTSPNTGSTIAQREALIGRAYKIVHFYQGWNESGTFPDAYQTSLAQGGRILYLAWDARNFNTNTPVPWADIASGKQDAVIDLEASKVKALGIPIFMDFSQEPEAEVDAGGYGTVPDFANAYRHIVERFRADGVTNVSWVWSVMGYSGYYSYYSDGLYPGDAYIDWIAWDPYNWYLCHNSSWKSFSEKVSSFYTWLLQNGHANKPFMLSEWGSRESDIDPGAKGRWFTDARDTMKAGTFPNLKALVYFDSNPSECPWAIDSSQASLDGYRAMAADSFFKP